MQQRREHRLLEAVEDPHLYLQGHARQPQGERPQRRVVAEERAVHCQQVGPQAEGVLRQRIVWEVGVEVEGAGLDGYAEPGSGGEQGWCWCWVWTWIWAGIWAGAGVGGFPTASVGVEEHLFGLAVWAGAVTVGAVVAAEAD